jgi:hypothetical protein
MTASAHAGAFDFWFDLWRMPSQLPPLFSEPKLSRYWKKIIDEVPVGPNCEPRFVAGDDGLFRRTDYCHKVNPVRPSGFLEIGYDVPATFLTGFTEDDVIARWKDVRLQSQEFLGSSWELPTEVLKLLNVTAAQAWEKMLACAQGNPDRAREMYRSASFACAEESEILSKVGDLRASLPALAKSLEIAPFLDGTFVNRREREIKEQKAQLVGENSGPDLERKRKELAQIQRQEVQVWQWRNKMDERDLTALMEKYLPKLPRLHPLLAQVIFEEFLSLFGPDESAREIGSRFKKKRDQQAYLAQLILWLNTIDDRGCAALGLWPSANRVAFDALGDKANELMREFGVPKSSVIHHFMVVACPLERNAKLAIEVSELGVPSPIDQARQFIRLNDVYAEGRNTVWRELRDVRERYVSKAKTN